MLFCPSCNNIISVVTTAEEFYYKCDGCQTQYKPEAIDTLRYESISGTNLVVFKTILQNAGQDPVNPTVRNECKKCNHGFAKQVRLGDDMRLINVCIKCNNQWLEGISEN